MNKFNPIREIAKTNHWQSLYVRAKDLKLSLFGNNSDYAFHQLILLQWLEIYDSLRTDIAMGENYIDEEKLKDDLLTDAYLTYRRRKRKREREEHKDEGRGKKIYSKIPSVKFVNTGQKG